MNKPAVLFLCSQNSARSLMAEAFLNHHFADHFQAESAGLEPGVASPLAIEAMSFVDIDISQAKTKGVFDLFKSGRLFSYVISLCDETTAERCPIFPGAAPHIQWSFPDPASFQGSWAEKLERTIEVRNTIEKMVQEWGEATLSGSKA